MEKFRKIAVLGLVAGLLFVFAGCTAPDVEKVNVEEVKVYADPIAEKIFTGINEKNYAKFSEDFDQTMKDAVTDAKFNEIIKQLGECESKGIIGADKAQGYTRALYKASSSGFSRDLTFTIVFSAEGDKKVSGFFYK